MGLKLIARLVLLVDGLALVVPNVLAPILAIGVAQVTIQLVLGVLSVILALYFIIKKLP